MERPGCMMTRRNQQHPLVQDAVRVLIKEIEDRTTNDRPLPLRDSVVPTALLRINQVLLNKTTTGQRTLATSEI